MVDYRADLSPEQFRFHTRCYTELNEPTGSYTNLKYPSKPNFRKAIARQLHDEIGLGPNAFLHNSGESVFPKDVAELGAHYNVVGVKKGAKGDVVLISAIATDAKGAREHTPDLLLPVAQKPIELAYFEVYDSSNGKDQFRPATLPEAAKAKLKALVAKPAKGGKSGAAAGASPQTARLTAPDVVYGLAFSPDGELVAAGDAKGNVCLFAFATGERRFVASVGKALVKSLVFSPDGSAVFAGSKEIKRVDVATGAVTSTGAKVSDTATALAVSPSGQRLAAAKGGVVVVDVTTQKVLAKIGLTDVDSVLFVDEDTLLLAKKTTGNPAYTGFRRVKFLEKQPKLIMPAHADGPTNFHPLGARLVSREEPPSRELVICDRETLSETSRVKAPRAGWRFAADGATRVFVDVGDLNVACVETTSGKVAFSVRGIAPRPNDHTDLHQIAASSGGRLAIAVDQGVTLFGPDGKLHLEPQL